MSTMPDADVVEVLKQQLASGQSLEQTVKNLAQNDPQLAPIVQALTDREAEREHGIEQEELQAEQERQQLEDAAEHRRRTTALRTHFDELVLELDALRERLTELAGALGACPECLGDDPGCRWCRGRGAPGFMPPEPVAFQRLVMPALQLQARLHGRQIAAVDRGSTDERSAS